MRQEPAVMARWLVRVVAGEAPGPARRVLTGVAVSLLVVVLTAAALISVLAMLSAIAAVLAGIAVPRPTTGRPTVAWGLVAVTTVALVGAAMAVSWTSLRRTADRPPRRDATPSCSGGGEPQHPADVDDDRATRPPGS